MAILVLVSRGSGQGEIEPVKGKQEERGGSGPPGAGWGRMPGLAGDWQREGRPIGGGRRAG